MQGFLCCDVVDSSIKVCHSAEKSPAQRIARNQGLVAGDAGKLCGSLWGDYVLLAANDCCSRCKLPSPPPTNCLSAWS